MNNAFPVDDYTPYGYLDLPGHTRRLSPRGVMRSDGVGFRRHFPAYAAAYGGASDHYQAGIRVDGIAPTACRVGYHSSRVMIFTAPVETGDLECTWFMIDDDCLALRIVGPAGHRVRVEADYLRTVAADGGWGESGLVGRMVDGDVVLQSFEDGDAFVLRTDEQQPEIGLFPADPSGDRRPVTVIGSRGERVRVRSAVTTTIGPAEQTPRWFFLARGNTERAARDRLPTVAEAEAVLADRLDADDRFWAEAPVLDGDWPEHWRRGLVYDLETLRMMIKEPAGVYRHRWDAMQIQSPRVVLAEAAMDALALSWAEPEIAAELLHGTFADAPEPQVPCSREDGSYNMVSAEGAVCGTGPQWGYPFLVAERIVGAVDDRRSWIARLYRPMADYLRWWLDRRTDGDGWLVHACSWESGQDLSPRFGDQPLGGGHPTWRLRPADLHAAAAHAARVLSDFAAEVAPDEVDRWRRTETVLTERARTLWNGHRFADVDARTGRTTDVDETMLLAPIALGVGSADQLETMSSTVAEIDTDSLVWPMNVWTPALAATTLDRVDVAGRIATDLIDRAYRHWDSRTYDGTTTLPGVACEYWPLHGRCGGEGYGWGAFTVELLITHVIGLRVTDDGVQIRPWLPGSLRRPGAGYAVTLTVRGRRLRFVINVEPDDQLTVTGPDGQVRRAADGAASWSWGSL